MSRRVRRSDPYEVVAILLIAGVAAAVYGIWQLSPGPTLAGLFLMVLALVGARALGSR